jgi:hypothetical protein
MKSALLITFVFILNFNLSAKEKWSYQQDDSSFIRTLYDSALLSGESYDNLHYLCKNIGHRLTGSEGATKAINWSFQILKELPFDSVYLQEIEAPYWERGDVETATLHLDVKKRHALQISALGGSVSTNGILEGEIVEVFSLAELEERRTEVQGKIVFYNRPMDKSIINTFKSYGACVDQRYWGASMASRYGALAVMVRSMTTLTDDHAHTGSMGYEKGVDKIPAVAVSTKDADYLHELIAKGESLKVSLELDCRENPDIKSYNVIGEIKGSEFPNQYLIVGGHLDSWDIGEGAHDDGAGIVHSIEALRLLMVNGYKPKHSLRVVLFMNEENGNRGGITYASQAKRNNENHLFALESDNGGFSPRGFSIDGSDDQIEFLQNFKELLEPYGIHYFKRGYAGVDIGPLKHEDNIINDQILLMGLNPDPQRYFDYHHAETDVFENVNQRELELGGASMAAIIYLVDRYWLTINTL